MNILEEFWYGNLDPAEYDASPCEEYKELIRLILCLCLPARFRKAGGESGIG